MSVKNISNLTIKVVRGIYDTKNPKNKLKNVKDDDEFANFRVDFALKFEDIEQINHPILN